MTVRSPGLVIKIKLTESHGFCTKTNYLKILTGVKLVLGQNCMIPYIKKGSNSDVMWNFRGKKPGESPRKNKQTKSRERYDVTIFPCDLIFGMYVVKTLIYSILWNLNIIILLYITLTFFIFGCLKFSLGQS